MSTLSSDFNITPYFDDFNPTNQYYKVLFKPGFGVQTRELNTLQSILQNQISSMGDNIFEDGTIIQGCNFLYYDYYPYAKLKDNTIAGDLVTVDDYNCKFAVNAANLVAFIIGAQVGFESQNPNLNTIYLRYLNSSNTGNATAFTAGDILTIYDSNNSIYSVNVDSGSIGFSNTDTLIFESALAVNVTSTNTFSNGELITQATTGAKAVIVGINTTAFANLTILNIKPQNTDLTNNSINSTAWTFNTGFNISSNTTNSVANVIQIIGEDASGTLTTDNLGVILNINMSTQGTGYIVPPIAIIKTFSNGDVSQLSLTAKNYEAKVTVASVANTTGTGYAFGVSEGIIYQKGYFLYVPPQRIIVSSYNNSPDGVSVGFFTTESFVNSNSDSNLLDNASGAPNFSAPGADRLKLAPTLTVVNTANISSNNSFFVLTSWSEGFPFFQNQRTSYGQIGDEMAKRTYDQSGDFVITPFLISTQSASNADMESNTFTLIVHPGEGYVSGNRVQTKTNYFLQVKKSLNTNITTESINLNYGGYVSCFNVGGLFQFSTGDLVTLNDAAGNFLSNTQNVLSNPTRPGNTIGSARLKSVVFDNGVPGYSNAVYRIYLSDVNMNTGKNFRNVRNIFYQGSSANGTADCITITDSITGNSITQISNTDNNTLIFNIANSMLKNTNTINYIFRTQSQNLTGNTSGDISITLSTTGWTFPYTANSNLTTDQLSELTVFPLANAVASANLGLGASTNSDVNVTISGNNLFDVLSPGDFVKITDTANATNIAIKQVTNITNSTLFTVDSNLSFTTATANIVLFFPQNVPVNMIHNLRYANLNSSQKVLTINLGNTLSSNITFCVDYNVQVSNSVVTSKTSNRDCVVRINFSNNDAGASGPWSLGVPDVYRLKNVYLCDNVATANVNGTDVTNDFLIKSNHKENHLALSELMLNSTSNLTLSTSYSLLVVFDCFTSSSNGISTISSYSVNDAITTLDSLSSSTDIHSFEIPEVKSGKNNYYDLNNCVDFRPYVVTTANITSNVSLSTINPAISDPNTSFGNTANSSAFMNFPTPGSVVNITTEQYLPRIDRLVITSNGQFNYLYGNPSLDNLVPPPEPNNSMTINLLYIPPYPSTSYGKSANISLIIDKKVYTDSVSYQRIANNTVAIPLIDNSDISLLQPQKYSMKNIGDLERRIAALEQYLTNLSTQPSSVQDLGVSSNNNVVAFLVDDFSTTAYTDFNNPENMSFIDASQEVIPLNNMFNIEYEFNSANGFTSNAVSGSLALLPFEEITLVKQSIATVPNTNLNCICGCNSEIQISNVVQQSTISIFVTGFENETDNYVFSNSSGAAYLFYNFKENVSGCNVAIYQGSTPDFFSNTSIPILTLANNGIGANSSVVSNYDSYGGQDEMSWQTNTFFGVISWTHDPSEGDYYVVSITTPNGSDFDYLISYPTDSFLNVSGMSSITPTVKYVGTLTCTSNFKIVSKSSQQNLTVSQIPNIDPGRKAK